MKNEKKNEISYDNKRDLQLKVAEALKSLDAAWKNLNELWIFSEQGKINEFLTENYPFRGCFNELYGDVKAWTESASHKLLNVLSFDEFRRTKVRVPAVVANQINGYDSEADVVLVYTGQLYIEEVGLDEYHLVIENQDWLSTDLCELEKKLYEFYLSNKK